MNFKTVIIFIIAIAILLTTNIANHMLNIDMSSKLVFIKKMF